jgi:hypothetical protein
MAEHLAVVRNVTPRTNLPGSAYAEAVIDDEFAQVINFYVGCIDVRYDRFVAAGTAHSNQMDYLTLAVESIMLDRFCDQSGHLNFWDLREELSVDTKYLASFEPARANFLASLALDTKRWPSHPETS